MQNFNIKVHEKSIGFFLIEIAGPLDSVTYSQLDQKMLTILRPTLKRLVLDMSRVDYVSSMGIGSIFKIRKFAKDNNVEFAILNLQSQVKKVFDTVQAMPQEAIFSSIEEMDAYLDQIQKNTKPE